MSQLKYQIVRNGTSKWTIWKLSPATPLPNEDGHMREYEEYARVVFDDGSWFVEMPRWNADGISGWDRLLRPWALKEGAIASVTKPKTKEGAAA